MAQALPTNTLLPGRTRETASRADARRPSQSPAGTALSALAFLGATDLYDAVRAARAAEPPEPLLRGEDILELGIAPGPEVGRLLELVAEERAVGTIRSRDEALELVSRELTPEEPK